VNRDLKRLQSYIKRKGSESQIHLSDLLDYRLKQFPEEQRFRLLGELMILRGKPGEHKFLLNLMAGRLTSKDLEKEERKDE
jgi:hypothetical protein